MGAVAVAVRRRLPRTVPVLRILLAAAVGVVVDVAVVPLGHLLVAVVDPPLVRRRRNLVLSPLRAVARKWRPVTLPRRHCFCARPRRPVILALSLVALLAAGRRLGLRLGRSPASHLPPAAAPARLMLAAARASRAINPMRPVPTAALTRQVPAATGTSRALALRRAPVAVMGVAPLGVARGPLPRRPRLPSLCQALVGPAPFDRPACRRVRPRTPLALPRRLLRGHRRPVLQHRGGHRRHPLRRRVGCRCWTRTCRSLCAASSSPRTHRGPSFRRRGRLLRRLSVSPASTRSP